MDCLRMSTSDLSGQTGHSPASSTPAESREKLQDLLLSVKELHDAALHELQAKITKLKKERCLDAQRLSEFHSKNQQLREQQKILQEKITQLEDRVCSGPCDRCAVIEKQIIKTNTEFIDANQKNLSVISELEAERKTLKDENRRLSLELERLRKSGSPQNVFSEAEEGMIPDSPRRPLSLPVASKMKRRKEQNHVRYAETPLSLSHPEPRRGAPSVPFGCNGNGVLVAETCEMDVTSMAEPNTKKHFRTVVPETCRIEVNPEQDNEDDDLHTERGQQPESNDCANIITAVQNDDSPSILHCRPLVSREQQQPPADDFPHTPSNNSTCVPGKGKRKHTDGRKREEKISVSSLDDPDETEIKGMILASTPASGHKESKNQETTDSKRRKCLDQHTPRKSSLQNQNTHFPYDQSWSVDPGADLAQYDTESSLQPEARFRTDLETMDTDCTFVSHSLLLRGQKRTGQSQTPGIGQRANDSLADIFDKTGFGEYESCPQDESSVPKQDSTFEEERGEDDDDDDEEEEEVAAEEFRRPADLKRVTSDGDTSNRNKSFARVEVVRKKDERRKLKGHYCKECEIYYAHLPEEERLKKLSSCSRHRYRYIPPSTPENFWEVGFPSTQTCVERGYIKEDDQPDVRIRRRRPYLAMFSPKVKSQKKQH
ncbi:DNA endonuclease RBBP8 isoform X2 [Rhinichthys klamathensis goyatoka]|uniref:DNA endonuclease RBBP8 isoform X2 n=1 Tax=Rhinichthys klamathensis goyatoka TaxID=3034132 RepID=UPI0024B58C61|nr:DNA endonuclease RBBP8 isoform X2 [Rhinichthys klamathensis goyatoka]